MQLINFYKKIWIKRINLKDRLLFGLMLTLISGFYFYTVIFRRHESVWDHLIELGVCTGSILLILVVKFIGNMVFKIWLSVSGTFGQVIFFIIQFVVFYLILSPVYILVNLAKKKNRSTHSNWSINPHRNTNYKNPG